jgi:hypothetical protein
MKTYLLVCGKIIIFLIIIFLLIILISKLVLDFPKIDSSIIIYCLLLCGGAIIIVVPEISEIKFFGFGIKKEDIDFPKIAIAKTKSNAYMPPKEDNKNKK